ncbi:MAG: carbon-nitrogen hydrolase family protein [Defluviitaleaceae bacterium]|nr:carbon-nitrogen hydrolase family protein [Defluviitaleaceae bacterium]
MKIALIVPRILKDINTNITKINELISDACTGGAKFILLPEATITGLINNDVYEHDISIAISISDKIITNFCEKAKINGIWLCFGFLEKEKGSIYDSAVLINPMGEISIHYRRINPQWRAKNLPSNQYSEGFEMKSAITPFGKTAVLICGDLFDDNVLSLLDPIQPEFVLFPFARCFPSSVKDIQKEWDEVEVHEYIKQAQRTCATVAMTNYIGTADINDTSFGGALIVDKDGSVLTSLPLFHEGILYYEFNDL